MQFHESLALGFNSHEFCIFLIDRIKQHKDYTIPYPVFNPITIFPWNRYQTADYQLTVALYMLFLYSDEDPILNAITHRMKWHVA